MSLLIAAENSFRLVLDNRIRRETKHANSYLIMPHTHSIRIRNSKFREKLARVHIFKQPSQQCHRIPRLRSGFPTAIKRLQQQQPQQPKNQDVQKPYQKSGRYGSESAISDLPLSLSVSKIAKMLSRRMNST